MQFENSCLWLMFVVCCLLTLTHIAFSSPPSRANRSLVNIHDITIYQFLLYVFYNTFSFAENLEQFELNQDFISKSKFFAHSVQKLWRLYFVD